MSFSLCVCALCRTYRSQFLRLRPEIRNIRPSRDWEEAFFWIFGKKVFSIFLGPFRAFLGILEVPKLQFWTQGREIWKIKPRRWWEEYFFLRIFEIVPMSVLNLWISFLNSLWSEDYLPKIPKIGIGNIQGSLPNPRKVAILSKYVWTSIVWAELNHQMMLPATITPHWWHWTFLFKNTWPRFRPDTMGPPQMNLKYKKNKLNKESMNK